MMIKNFVENVQKYGVRLLNINNHTYLVKADDNDKLLIMADVHENTSFVLEDNYRYRYNEIVIALHSVINDYLKTSLVQHKY